MGDEAAYNGFRTKLGHKAVEDILEDVDTLAELDFMHALQDCLLTEYDKVGLIIETSPTSNVYIARLNSHTEHPIFRWCRRTNQYWSSGVQPTCTVCAEVRYVYW